MKVFAYVLIYVIVLYFFITLLLYMFGDPLSLKEFFLYQYFIIALAVVIGGFIAMGTVADHYKNDSKDNQKDKD